jgi:hypothetical protein
MMGINNLAATLESWDEYLESERIYESAHRLGVKMLGEHDSDTLTSCSGLGQSFKAAWKVRRSQRPASTGHLGQNRCS